MRISLFLLGLELTVIVFLSFDFGFSRMVRLVFGVSFSFHLVSGLQFFPAEFQSSLHFFEVCLLFSRLEGVPLLQNHFVDFFWLGGRVLVQNLRPELI